MVGLELCLELGLGLRLGLGLGSGLGFGLGSLNCDFENNIWRHLLNIFNDFQLPIFINIILFFLYLTILYFWQTKHFQILNLSQNNIIFCLLPQPDWGWSDIVIFQSINKILSRGTV